MKTSDLFIKALENEGVEYVFGVPGEENLDILDSLRASRKIKFILTRHEQAAGFMAATVGRFTGKPGVALTTLGPGATNLVTAAAYAELGGMPLFMITGQKPIKKSKQGSFQIVNTTEILRPVTKFTKQIVHGETVPSLVREAFRRAEEERPGAVHLELPEDIAAEEAKATELFGVNKVRRPVAEEKAIAAAVAMIQDAKRPLVLIGAGAVRKRTSRMLREFVDKTGIPFVHTQMGKGVIDEHHPLYIGTAALSMNDRLHDAIDKADLILNVGHDVVEKPPFLMKHGGAKVIHLNFFSAQVDEIYFPELEVVGDIANAIWQIKERITPQKKWDFGLFLEVKKDLEKSMMNGMGAAEAKSAKRKAVFGPEAIIAEVQAVMPGNGIVALDNGMYKIWFARNYKVSEPNGLLLDNALATMGAGLPSGIAARLVHPDPEKKILVVAGDGGFLMTGEELETAVRLKLDLVVLILNDNGFGMIQWKQGDAGFESFGLQYGNPDFVAYAKSFGAHGIRAEKPGDVSRLIGRAFRTGGVHVIEAPMDYTESFGKLGKRTPRTTKRARKNP